MVNPYLWIQITIQYVNESFPSKIEHMDQLKDLQLLLVNRTDSLVFWRAIDFCTPASCGQSKLLDSPCDNLYILMILLIIPEMKWMHSFIKNLMTRTDDQSMPHRLGWHSTYTPKGGSYNLVTHLLESFVPYCCIEKEKDRTSWEMAVIWGTVFVAVHHVRAPFSDGISPIWANTCLWRFKLSYALDISS